MSLINVIAAMASVGAGVPQAPPSDTTPPTVVSITATSATNVRVVFSEATTPTIAGWHVDNGLQFWYPSQVVFVSGFTWDFTVSGLASGQLITMSYNSTTGNTKDAANNELVSIIERAVTNNVSAPPSGTPGIWIGIGQSNFGNAEFTDLNSQDTVTWQGVMAKAFILNPYVSATQYVPYNPGVNSMLMNYGTTQFGAEMSFIKAAINETGANQYFLKFAYGSTALEGNWESPNGTYYPALKVHMATAIAAAKVLDPTAVVKGFIMINGEHDTRTAYESGLFLTNLQNFFTDTRAYAGTLDAASANFVALMAKTAHGILTYLPVVQQAQIDYCATPANRAALAETTDLPTVDNLHYTAAACITLGNRLYAAYKTVPPVAADTTPPSLSTITALNTTTLRAVFSETTTPTIAGWTFNNGGSITPSAVSFVSGFTWDFTVAGIAYGQTITSAYSSATGNTKDASNNELVTFSGRSVVNSIAAPGGQTGLTFSVIPFSDPDLRRPGCGLEFWIYQSSIRVPSAGSPSDNEEDRYDRFEWRSFENGSQGVYSWAEFDASINTAIDKGQKFSFGIMSLCESCSDFTTTVGGGQLTSYPLYVHNLMQAEGGNNADWVDPTTGCWIPNWNSLNYLNPYRNMLNALAAHISATSYSGVNYASIIRYVDVRGIGNYNEWHHYPYLDNIPTGRFPTIATYKRIVDDFATAFPNYQLVALCDGYDTVGWSNTPAEVVHYLLTKTNTKGLLGYRRDNIGSGWAGTSYWVGDKLENNPAVYNPGTGNVILKNLIVARWQTAPAVGEVMNCCSTDGGSQLYWDLVRQASFYHLNSLGNGNLESPASSTTINAMRLAAKTMGFRLQINSGTISSSIVRGAPFSLSLLWQNSGVSPTYESWNAVLEMRSGATVVWSGTSSFIPLLFLPGSTTISDSFTIGTGVAPGTYNLHLTVKDPNNYRSPMPLYITGVQGDGSYIIKSNVVVT